MNFTNSIKEFFNKFSRSHATISQLAGEVEPSAEQVKPSVFSRLVHEPDFRRKVAVISVIVLVVFGGTVMSAIVSRNMRDIGAAGMPVYFFNSAEGRLDAEIRPWPSPQEDVVQWAAIAIGYLLDGPGGSLARTWPDVEFSEFITGLYMYYPMDDYGNVLDSVLVAAFSELYNEMTALDEALFRSAFTLTMAGIPGIDRVMFRVTDGEYVWETVDSAASITNAPPSISPLRLQSTAQFTLYFIDETGEGLVTETYEAVDIDIQQRGRESLRRLIEITPADGAVNPIPPETRILNFRSDSGFVYVDLSSEFLRFNGTSAQAYLMIYSMVNTFLTNTHISRDSRVFFLVNSERITNFHGVSDFHLGFVYNESIMMDYVAYYETDNYYEGGEE